MRVRNTWTRGSLALSAAGSVLFVGIAGCLGPPVETPVTTVFQETDVRVEQNVKNKVDILFLIDDSPSMTPKQAALKERFGDLVKVLDDFGTKGNPAWYHIGVVTSDLGSAASTACPKVGGLGAQLQPLGKAHGAGCVAPTGGLNYIDYNQLAGTNNLPTGVALADEFTCMASVGDTGCGFEHQLEATYRALHDCQPGADGSYAGCNIAANKGFLRNDSILAVVYVTDEDDCSAPPDTDLFDQNKTNAYGALDSYRCTEYGVECNIDGMTQLMQYKDSGGALSGCIPAPNPGGNSQGLPPAGQGKLLDVSRYINFFTHSNMNGGDGIRADPSDVILAGIIAPPTPVSSDLQNPMTGATCAALGMSCAVTLVHSCNASTDFFGDPSVRISAVLDAANGSQETSICAMDYTSALQALGMKIVSKIGVACLSSPITDPANPNCIVEDRSNVDDSVIGAEIQSCAITNNVEPCWLYQESDKCPQVINPVNGTITQGSISIKRDMSAIPPGSHARVACATLAHTSGGTTPSPGP